MPRKNPFFRFVFFYGIALVILIVLHSSGAMAISSAEEKKVDYLLSKVESSNLTFIRNGKSYDSQDAYAHLKMKFDYAKDDIKTADDFIKYIASGSSVSGKPYFVKLPGGKKTEAGEWLRDQLAKMPKAE